MVSSDFRKEAREKLDGKWGKGACITLAYIFIIIVMDLISGVFSDNMQALLSLVITIVLNCSCLAMERMLNKENILKI